MPPLLKYDTEAEYRAHYDENYCQWGIVTFDNIPIRFRLGAPDDKSNGTFRHAFFDSPNKDGGKEVFSRARAERMDWIKRTLQNPDAELYQGWGNSAYDANRRVAIAYENFAVVVSFNRKNGKLARGHFVTCYPADKFSLAKIRRKPWR